MNAFTRQTTIFFHPDMATVPTVVTIFTLLRQSECLVNELSYPELHCTASLADSRTAGEIASKLTAALSIHIDSFLGLSCADIDGIQFQFTARFSSILSTEDVAEQIRLRAADIIDTLLVIS